jgi:hypothetical protein
MRYDMQKFAQSLYGGSMKQKTSITRPSDVLAKEVDKANASESSRSAYIEQILQDDFCRGARRKAHNRDLHQLNAAAKRLNAEVDDILKYHG